MTMDRAERGGLIRQYAEGPARLRAALAAVPAGAMQWRPAPREWSAHEIAIHCADSEAGGALRIRYLIAEPAPLIVGYDQEQWAVRFDYHARPLDPALALIDAARANTAPLLSILTDADWSRVGRHTEAGPFGAEDWLRTYGVHLHDHADQIERNVAAWHRANRGVEVGTG